MATTQPAVQVFTVYNKSGQRLMFPGLIIPPGQARKTTDVGLFTLEEVEKALRFGAIEVSPNPKDFWNADSAVPVIDVTSLGGGGGGSGSGGDASILRSFLNASGLSMPRGTPVYSANVSEALPAIGNLIGKQVIGLYSGLTDLAPGAAGQFLVEGSLISSVAEWETITGMVGGLVRGKRYYLDLNFPGKLALTVERSTAPSGSYLVGVGYALTEIELKLEIQPAIRIA